LGDKARHAGIRVAGPAGADLHAARARRALQIRHLAGGFAWPIAEDADRASEEDLRPHGLAIDRGSILHRVRHAVARELRPGGARMLTEESDDRVVVPPEVISTGNESTSPDVSLIRRLKAPFQYFGGKSRAAHLIWQRFGNVPNYVEPFFGSGATLLARPHAPQTETINDMDTMIANFWRSIVHAPEAVADYADWPVNEADLHARHTWLVSQEDFRERMKVDPDYFDPKVAGWWVWGRCAWIGGYWCDPNSISDRTGRMPRPIPTMNWQGVHSKRIQEQGIQKNFLELARRLRRVRVCCGDWSRLVTPAVCTGLTGVLLDPPYASNEEIGKLAGGFYANNDTEVSGIVRRWAIENGDNPQLRIALCGYEGEHKMPDSWEKVTWKAVGGYSGETNDNAERERIWFSPACLKVSDTLFADYDEDEE